MRKRPLSIPRGEMKPIPRFEDPSQARKRLVAERAKAEADRLAALDDFKRLETASANVFLMIDKAAPFMDANTPPGHWRPSDKLKMTHCVAETGLESGPKAAVLFTLQMLDRARLLYVAGLDPDPWSNETVTGDPLSERIVARGGGQ